MFAEAEGRIPALKLPCRGSHICCRKTGRGGWNSQGMAWKFVGFFIPTTLFFFSLAQVRYLFISGCVASQWALPADGAELSGVHELPEGEECGSYQCDGKEPDIL